MGNIEHEQFQESETKTGLHGREAIGTDEALFIQTKLVDLMTPSELKPHIGQDIYDPVKNAVMMHWMEKYTLGDFNGFARYCEEVADGTFLERANSHNLNLEDYEKLVSFLTTPPSGKIFFTPAELEDFMAEYELEDKVTLH